MTGNTRSSDGGTGSGGNEDQKDLEARLALLSVTGIGPNRARWLLQPGDAAATVDLLRRGRLPEDIGPAPSGVGPGKVVEWGAALRELDVAETMERHRRLGIGIMSPSDDRWPLTEDPDPPALLFHKGNLDLLDLAAAVAVVGTRRCTTVGRTVAYQLGQDLASANVVVVSGLALGIDGSAHRGALDGGGLAIAVVGSGLDVVYPGGNRVLWNEVASLGLLLSESPAGAKPARWRFPARNRLIAALSDGVIVVESHHRGGALLTADEAVDRGKPVFAVPGSVLSSASDGTNRLLFDGAVPVRDASDVLGHLGHGGTGHEASTGDEPSVWQADQALPFGDLPGLSGERLSNSPLETQILIETATGPAHLDVLVHATGSTAHEVLVAVQNLAAAGQLELDGSTVSRLK